MIRVIVLLLRFHTVRHFILFSPNWMKKSKNSHFITVRFGQFFDISIHRFLEFTLLLCDRRFFDIYFTLTRFLEKKNHLLHLNWERCELKTLSTPPIIDYKTQMDLEFLSDWVQNRLKPSELQSLKYYYSNLIASCQLIYARPHHTIPQ